MKNNFSYGIELREILKYNTELLNSKYSQGIFLQNLEYLTKKTDDKYLQERAKGYIEYIKSDEVLKNYLGRLKYSCIEQEYIKKYFNLYCIEKREEERKEYNIIDLFCGAGGMSLGFIQEGFDINLACDFDESCIETYTFNHPNTKSEYIIKSDIKEIDNDIKKYLSKDKVSLVIGGPPCQGFSNANQQRLIDDPRNKLYKSFVNIVEQVKPKFFVMENVRGMLKVANQVKEDFEKVGYKVSYKILQARDFGVPQNRERLIFIGTYLSINPQEIFNLIEGEYSPKEYILKDAIADLNELEASTQKNNTNFINEKNGGIVIKKINKNINDYLIKINNTSYIYPIIFNHQARYNNDRDIEIYSRLHQGDKSDDPKIADIMPYASRSHIFKDKYYKLKESDVSKTITAHMKFDCNMYIHPTQARGLTPREAARIQSYPDDYIFRGAFTKTYMQVGNSVPPLMARGIAKVIKKILQEEK